MKTIMTATTRSSNQLQLRFIFNVTSKDGKLLQRESQWNFDHNGQVNITAAQAKQITDIFNKNYAAPMLDLLQTHAQNYTHSELVNAIGTGKTLSANQSQATNQKLHDLAHIAHLGIQQSVDATKAIIAPKSKVQIPLAINFTS